MHVDDSTHVPGTVASGILTAPAASRPRTARPAAGRPEASMLATAPVPPRTASVDTEHYAPFPLVADGGRWGLTRREVRTRVGTVVVRHRVGVAPLLLVHGAAGSWTTWTPLLAAAGGFGSRGLVLVDLPGWGESAAADRPLDAATATAVLLDVLDALALPTVDVVGHSLGAVIALELAVAAPGRVWSVALVSPTGASAMQAARHPVRGLVRLPAFTLLQAGFAVAGGIVPAVLRAAAGVGALPAIAGPVFAHPGRVDRSVLRAFVQETRPRAFLAAAREAARYRRDRWSDVRCPVVLIAGLQDAFARRTDARALRAVVPQTRRVIVPDCGHFAHVEHPDVVARALDPLV